MRILLIAFACGVIALAADLPAGPTPLTQEEIISIQSAAMLYYQARIQVLEALMGDRLGAAIQKQESNAQKSFSDAMAAMQKKHGAEGCALIGDGKWSCPPSGAQPSGAQQIPIAPSPK